MTNPIRDEDPADRFPVDVVVADAGPDDCEGLVLPDVVRERRRP